MVLLLAGCGSLGLDYAKFGEQGEETGLDGDTGETGGSGNNGGGDDTAPESGDDESDTQPVDTGDPPDDSEETAAETESDPPIETGSEESDPPVDTSPPEDTEPPRDTSGYGYYGGLMEMFLVQIACPDCLSLSSDLQVSADGAFHDPTTAGWFDWLPAVGTCVDTPSSTAPASTYLDAGPTVTLSGGSATVSLTSASGLYSALGLGEADFPRSTTFDITASGGSDIAGFSESGVLTTPAAISTLTPTELLFTTPNRAWSAAISVNAATFTWSPSGTSDDMLVVLDVYTSRGVYQHTVTCLSTDAGTITVPASMFIGDSVNDLVVAGFYRYALSEFERPDNASTVQTLAALGVIGTGYLVP